MAKVDKNELGKGIRALLGNAEQKNATSEERTEPSPTPIMHVQLSQIEINPFQPRNEFDEEMLKELSDSILTFGLIQPASNSR